MRHVTRSGLVGKIALLCLASAASLPALGLDYSEAHASAIVVGSVESRVESRVGDTGQVEFTIHVLRVLKGNLPGPAVNIVHRGIRILLIDPMPVTITHQAIGIWFLR